MSHTNEKSHKHINMKLCNMTSIMFLAERSIKWRRDTFCEQASEPESQGCTWKHFNCGSDLKRHTKGRYRGVLDRSYLKAREGHCPISLSEESSSTCKHQLWISCPFFYLYLEESYFCTELTLYFY